MSRAVLLCPSIRRKAEAPCLQIVVLHAVVETKRQLVFFDVAAFSLNEYTSQAADTTVTFVFKPLSARNHQIQGICKIGANGRVWGADEHGQIAQNAAMNHGCAVS